MIHVWTAKQQNGVELAQYRGKSICFLSFWDVSTIIFCLDCPCAKHKGVCLCETVFFIIYAFALTEFRASFVMWAWIDWIIPSNKQQTIAFFISTPASRPLPPPVSWGLPAYSRHLLIQDSTLKKYKPSFNGLWNNLVAKRVGFEKCSFQKPFSTHKKVTSWGYKTVKAKK